MCKGEKNVSVYLNMVPQTLRVLNRQYKTNFSSFFHHHSIIVFKLCKHLSCAKQLVFCLSHIFKCPILRNIHFEKVSRSGRGIL